MQSLKGLLNEVKKSQSHIIKYTSNRALVTDIISKLFITFGVALIIGGLYLVIANPWSSYQANQSAASVIDWVPAIPFSTTALVTCSSSTVGLVSWIIGVDLLLLGLGFWVRNNLARLVGLIMITLAAVFQFIDFIQVGIMGSVSSVVVLFVDGLIAYFLLSRYDSLKSNQGTLNKN